MPSWLTLGNIADILGVLGGIAAFFAWLQSRKVSEELEAERQRKDKKIRVILSYGADELELPVEMRRGEFTRAEILGRIGMIPMKTAGKRFELTRLTHPSSSNVLMKFWMVTTQPRCPSHAQSKSLNNLTYKKLPNFNLNKFPTTKQYYQLLLKRCWLVASSVSFFRFVLSHNSGRMSE